MSRPLKTVARELAIAHRAADNKTSLVKLFPSAQADEIHLLEVSAGAPTTGEVLPFRFAADVVNGVDYPSVVILLSPEEWQKIETGKLLLPSDWDLTIAEDL